MQCWHVEMALNQDWLALNQDWLALCTSTAAVDEEPPTSGVVAFAFRLWRFTRRYWSPSSPYIHDTKENQEKDHKKTHRQKHHKNIFYSLFTHTEHQGKDHKKPFYAMCANRSLYLCQLKHGSKTNFSCYVCNQTAKTRKRDVQTNHGSKSQLLL